MDLEDKQAEIDTIRNDLAEVTICLEQAESCETKKDFDANIAQALAAVEELRKNLIELKSS
jgi:hypothetical protein